MGGLVLLVIQLAFEKGELNQNKPGVLVSGADSPVYVPFDTC